MVLGASKNLSPPNPVRAGRYITVRDIYGDLTGRSRPVRGLSSICTVRHAYQQRCYRVSSLLLVTCAVSPIPGPLDSGSDLLQCSGAFWAVAAGRLVVFVVRIQGAENLIHIVNVPTQQLPQECMAHLLGPELNALSTNPQPAEATNRDHLSLPHSPSNPHHHSDVESCLQCLRRRYRPSCFNYLKGLQRQCPGCEGTNGPGQPRRADRASPRLPSTYLTLGSVDRLLIHACPCRVQGARG